MSLPERNSSWCRTFPSFQRIDFFNHYSSGNACTWMHVYYNPMDPPILFVVFVRAIGNGPNDLASGETSDLHQAYVSPPGADGTVLVSGHPKLLTCDPPHEVFPKESRYLLRFGTTGPSWHLYRLRPHLLRGYGGGFGNPMGLGAARLSIHRRRNDATEIS